MSETILIPSAVADAAIISSPAKFLLDVGSTVFLEASVPNIVLNSDPFSEKAELYWSN